MPSVVNGNGHGASSEDSGAEDDADDMPVQASLVLQIVSRDSDGSANVRVNHSVTSTPAPSRQGSVKRRDYVFQQVSAAKSRAPTLQYFVQSASSAASGAGLAAAASLAFFPCGKFLAERGRRVSITVGGHCTSL